MLRPNTYAVLEEALERGAIHALYKVLEHMRDNEWDLGKDHTECELEQAREVIYNEVKDAIYESFEVHREEDAPNEAVTEINRGLFRIEKALDRLTVSNEERRSLVDNRGGDGAPKGRHPFGEPSKI